MCPRSFLTIYTNGNLILNFGWLQGSSIAETARDRFAELIRESKSIKVQDDYVKKYPNYAFDDWAWHSTKIITALKKLLAEFREV